MRQTCDLPRRALALLLAAHALLWAIPAQAESLHEVFERSWAQRPASQALGAQRDEVAASRQIAAALLPAPPIIGLAQRSDRWNERRGVTENEVEVALPLWLPGQKNARRSLADAEGRQLGHASAAARLAFAGELRTSIWTLNLARNEAEQQRQRRDVAARLEADVERRVRVGDMARTDLLLARQETASARLALSQAETQTLRATQRYRALTGSDQLPDNPTETPVGEAAAPAEHPALEAARAEAERAGAQAALARETRREPPSLALQYRQGRDQFSAPMADTIRIGVAIPLAADGRNAAQIAAANTAQIRSQAEFQRLTLETETTLLEAEAQLAAARSGAELATAREADANERLTLLRRAFELGEMPLPDYVRAQALAFDARLEAARSRIQLGAAVANLNQARGITP